ncbi:MAG: Tex family protein [Bacilli bacterium]
MNNEVINNMSKEMNISSNIVQCVIEMLKSGSTIPFIARYRKEVTGSLNEDELRSIESVYKYNVNLNDRKETIKKLIDEKGMLTEKLSYDIELCSKLSELEDIYLPYKEKKKTKGTEAIKLGLEPLAEEIMKFTCDETEANKYLNKDVPTIEFALTNAGYIIADKISDNAKYRKWIKAFIYDNGYVVTTKKKQAVDDKKLYEMYYDFKEKVKFMKSYRTLAISRAEKSKIITYKISVDTNNIILYLIKEITSNKEFPLKKMFLSFIEDAYKRLIFPSIEREIKTFLFDKASEEGIKEFGNNLEHLLLTPPIKETVVMGFDPAFRTGCKLAVVSENGVCLEISVVYPHEPKNMVIESKKIILDLINKYNVKIIAIGNGTASRESEKFISSLIAENNLSIKYIIVSEAGASVYSASAIAKKEFPDFSVEQRSAVSIARRLQDALSELVKIDPCSIGVGLYQHDIKQKELEEELSFVTSKIVNKVGVNINNASEKLLSYVSGINNKVIKAISEYKLKHGKIMSREELLKIKNIDQKVYTQAAGFLRIIDGNNPLDKTNIHPEDYELTYKILNDNDISVDLIGTPFIKELLLNVDFSIYNISIDKENYIKENLCDGIIDPRSDIPTVTLKSNILTIDDLKEGMEIEGTVRNVTSFGAFIDIGLHDDALVHISKMSKEYIKHPSEVLNLGDIIKAYVDNIDKEKERVNLSLLSK